MRARLGFAVLAGGYSTVRAQQAKSVLDAANAKLAAAKATQIETTAMHAVTK